MKTIKEFIEMLEESIRKHAEEIKKTCEEIQRFVVSIEAQDRAYRSFRSYPPYRERMKPRRFNKRIYWHRIRSNPYRRRKPH